MRSIIGTKKAALDPQIKGSFLDDFPQLLHESNRNELFIEAWRSPGYFLSPECSFWQAAPVLLLEAQP